MAPEVWEAIPGKTIKEKGDTLFPEECGGSEPNKDTTRKIQLPSTISWVFR